MTEHDSHLSGSALEALAAGDAADARDAGHLENCARCRAAVSSLRDENAIFTSELNESESVTGTEKGRGIGMTNATMASGSSFERRAAAQSHKPFVIYAIAASIMLVTALALIHFGRTETIPAAAPQVTLEAPKKSTLDRLSDKSRETAVKPPDSLHAETPPIKADEKENPKPAPKPPDAESVYEGQTAAQWLAQLAANPTNEFGKKAVHALSEIGRDALPQIVEMLRTTGDDSTALVLTILKEIRFEKDDLSQFMVLLKDDKFAVRKTGVLLLASLVREVPETENAVQAALTPLLQDRDKAVVEAAREALKTISGATKRKEYDALIARSKQALASQDYRAALAAAKSAQLLFPAFGRKMQDDIMAKIAGLNIAQPEMERKKEEADRAAIVGARGAEIAVQIQDVEQHLSRARADGDQQKITKMQDVLKSLRSDLDNVKKNLPAAAPQSPKAVVGEQGVDF